MTSTRWRGIAIDSPFYEIVRFAIGDGPAGPETSAAAHDIYIRHHKGELRLVSGYLMVEGDGEGSARGTARPGTLTVFSHGNVRLTVTVEDERHFVAKGYTTIEQADESSVILGSGLGILAGEGCEIDLREGFEPGGDSSAPRFVTLAVRSRGDMTPPSVAIVHGPALEKVQNRIVLLKSMERV